MGPVRFDFKRQRHFFGEIGRARTRKSPGRHLGVNIPFADITVADITVQEQASAADSRRLLVRKSQQPALFAPVDRDIECQAHQFLGGELRRVFAVDDGGDNVGRQQGQTQQPEDVVTRSWLAMACRGRSVFCIRRAWISCARAMILSSPGSANVWSSAFSTSICISRPTRCSRAFTFSVRTSSLSGLPHPGSSLWSVSPSSPQPS
jgi:hypothetical protein